MRLRPRARKARPVGGDGKAVERPPSVKLDEGSVRVAQLGNPGGVLYAPTLSTLFFLLNVGWLGLTRLGFDLGSEIDFCGDEFSVGVRLDVAADFLADDTFFESGGFASLEEFRFGG